MYIYIPSVILKNDYFFFWDVQMKMYDFKTVFNKFGDKNFKSCGKLHVGKAEHFFLTLSLSHTHI